MPAIHMDLQGYANFLTACANDPRFNYGTLMAAIRKENPNIGLVRSPDLQAVRRRRDEEGILERARDNAWFDRRPRSGPGRVDTFNPYKVILRLPIDDVGRGPSICRRSGTSGCERGCGCTGTATTTRWKSGTRARQSAPARRRIRWTSS